MKTFPTSVLARLLSQQKAKQVAPPQPVVVHVDLGGLADILAKTPISIKHGQSVVPS